MNKDIEIKEQYNPESNYVAGLVTQKRPKNKNDLYTGTFCILEESTYGYSIVVKYITNLRETDRKDFYENVIKLLEEYNCQVLPEHDPAFYTVLNGTGKLHLLFTIENLAKEINPNTRTNHSYGLYPTAINKEYIYRLAFEFIEENNLELNTQETLALGYAIALGNYKNSVGYSFERKVEYLKNYLKGTSVKEAKQILQKVSQEIEETVLV